MNKHNIDPQNPATMKFEKLYNDALKKTWKIKWEHDLEKKMSEDMLKKLNWQKKLPMKNDSINVQTNRTLSLMIKLAEWDKDKKKSKDKSRDKSKNKAVE